MAWHSCQAFSHAGGSLTSINNALNFNLTETYSCFRNGAQKTIDNLTDLLCDLEGLQKVCLAAHALLELVSVYQNKQVLAKFRASLNIANSFDLYGFLKIPNRYIHPIDLECLDEARLLNTLEKILCRCWIDQEMTNDPQIRHFAQQCIQKLIDDLTEDEWTEMTRDDFALMLQNCIEERLQAIDDLPQNWSREAIDLSLLPINHFEKSWSEKIGECFFVSVDLLCVPAFLGEWEVIDLDRYSAQLGRSRLLAWTTRYSLDDWIRAGLCAGFLLQMLNALHCLLLSNPSPIVRKRAGWDLVVSATELVFNLSALCNARAPVVFFLTFVAKSTGVFSILFRPDRPYFENG
ncbi:MAG: hypothetical protein LW832_08715 [Parachlamydia sp.]|nr:hypothetical protein [Parachlamydia sp.]